jgi:hypothetical protein
VTSSKGQDGRDPADIRMEAQWERASQAWELVVHASRDALSPEHRGALTRILRVKRSERAVFDASLPGVVRRGARVDLQPIEDQLREAGLPCQLRRHSGTD